MFNIQKTILSRFFVLLVSLILFQEIGLAQRKQSEIDQSFKYAGVVLAFSNSNSSSGDKCSGIVMDGTRILTARHCWWEGSALYVSHDSDYGWAEDATVSFPKSCGQECSMGMDFLRINIRVPAGNNIQIKTFRQQKDVLKYLKNSIAHHLEGHSWGNESGLQKGKIVSIHENENLLELEMSVTKGDSGGPVWIEDKLIGTIYGYRPENGNMLVSIFSEDLFK